MRRNTSGVINNDDSPDVRWRPRLGYYANNSKNGKLFVEKGPDGKPDPTKPIEAVSYVWWVFFLKVGEKYIMNRGHYSSQTSSHQSGVAEIVDKLGIKYLTIHTKAHLGEPDAVLKELQTRVYEAEQRVAFTFTKRCKAGWYSSIEERRKAATKTAAECRKELQDFVTFFEIEDSKVKLSQKQVEDLSARRLERDRKERREGAEGRKEIEKRKRQVLAESWKPLSEMPHAPITERTEYRIDAAGKGHDTQALAAFLTTDTTRQRFGNYFIDGNELLYRLPTVDGAAVTLEENVIARKFVEDGRLVIIGNSSNLKLIGRYVAYGNVRENSSETDIQKQLKQYVAMIPFKEFQMLRNKWTKEVTQTAVPMTLANIMLYRLTGKVPGRKAA